jgi:hypothetical protein
MITRRTSPNLLYFKKYTVNAGSKYFSLLVHRIKLWFYTNIFLKYTVNAGSNYFRLLVHRIKLWFHTNMLNFNKDICRITKYIKKNATPNKQIPKFQKFLVQQNLQKESPV